MNAFDDWFAKNMPDTEAWAAQFAAEPVTARPKVEPMGEPTPDDSLVSPGLMEAIKLTSYIEVPNELLMDYGLIPDTRPPRPPTPWRWRMRNKIGDLRERAARRAYRIIAGGWPDNREDDW